VIKDDLLSMWQKEADLYVRDFRVNCSGTRHVIRIGFSQKDRKVRIVKLIDHPKTVENIGIMFLKGEKIIRCWMVADQVKRFLARKRMSFHSIVRHLMSLQKAGLLYKTPMGRKRKEIDLTLDWERRSEIILKKFLTKKVMESNVCSIYDIVNVEISHSARTESRLGFKAINFTKNGISAWRKFGYDKRFVIVDEREDGKFLTIVQHNSESGLDLRDMSADYIKSFFGSNHETA
jgi:hypothetical protein